MPRRRNNQIMAWHLFRTSTNRRPIVSCLAMQSRGYLNAYIRVLPVRLLAHFFRQGTLLVYRLSSKAHCDVPSAGAIKTTESPIKISVALHSRVDALTTYLVQTAFHFASLLS